ncbi:low molecular weight protein-tyrosine-phosphatase [Mycolicibacterium sp. P1-5]|uniref:low molecular weight protein-tyrosine-phosphatase n=1 Tax=Mycolicibacterium sp. P1-5 TaxID=2024617 RepID=UPI0011EF38BB|nr:low molecular weight protein-tyrosine-phosphatase [Mycolicibacterium sp. P1-5]KAA0108180.1 low molecular weight phosphotyrosine protein phosphatase [Mycolicibacterium sp. P1-5]
MSEPLLHITFVCSGNICRSPMAEKMFAHQIDQRGLADLVRVTSAGTGDWHAGNAADERANAVLRQHGYPTEHCAAQVDDDHLAADLVIALGRNHVRMLTHLGVEPERVRLLRSFDPRSGAHPGDVEDPYYGGAGDFQETFTVIEAALPGLHAWVDERLPGAGMTG